MYLEFCLTIFCLIFIGFLLLDREEGNIKRGLAYGVFLSILFTIVGYISEAIFNIF